MTGRAGSRRAQDCLAAAVTGPSGYKTLPANFSSSLMRGSGAEAVRRIQASVTTSMFVLPLFSIRLCTCPASVKSKHRV